MKQFKLLSIVTLFIASTLSLPALAEKSTKTNHKEHQHQTGEQHDHSDQSAKVTKLGAEKILIKVDGMVCPFCAQGVEKNFKNRKKEVKDVKVDMDNMTVEVFYNKGQSLDKKTLETLIKNAGFSYGGILE